MVRDPYYDNDDTEYQLNETEDVNNVFDEENDNEPSVSEEKSQSKKSLPNSGGSRLKKIIIWFVVIVLAVLVVYKVFVPMLTMKHTQPVIKATAEVSKSKVEEQKIAEDLTASAQKIQATAQATKKPSEEAVQTVPPMQLDQSNSQNKEVFGVSADQQQQLMQGQKMNEQLLTELKKQLQASQKQLAGLNQQVNQQVNGLSDNINHLHEAIANLADQVKAEKARNRAIARYRATQAARRAKAVRASKRYFVKAVIPGRAWVQAADGSSMSVTVGDSVPGYGRVTGIDAFSGKLSTSSGISIQYGLN
ncbi:MAG: hypothetical protein ABIH77_01210 [Pseudomonadota bacterium]|nr:hypothetical protein [Gammaproteobacteria bacterium]MBU1558449.1 hypothetical protein [Gammaproteobacteria bacterium]MBU1628766.1 hypothetical protein [Gammaproteobacteria bacterium]MBU1926657.1 hypothetical protein [Gammaproteobacteria bacterium]MBU2546546.1 hypothetical protein [Gammaproteobacteria bacterium]